MLKPKTVLRCSGSLSFLFILGLVYTYTLNKMVTLQSGTHCLLFCASENIPPGDEQRSHTVYSMDVIQQKGEQGPEQGLNEKRSGGESAERRIKRRSAEHTFSRKRSSVGREDYY